MKIYDVTIIGGGVPGMALAALLAPSGLKVLLADAAPPPPALKDVKPDGRTAALMGGSIDILTAARIWAQAKDFGSPLKRMAVIDDSKFPAQADAMIEQIFDAKELGREAFGWNMPLTAMRACLADELAKFKNVTFFTKTTLVDFLVGANDVMVTLDDQKSFTTKLLIGCDGRDSAVRKKSNIDAKRRAYNQSAITCLISHTRPHNDTSSEFHRPGGPFTIVPMQGDVSAIVWVEKDADANAFLKLPRASLIEALQDRTRNRVGKIDLLSNPTAWPLEYLRSHTLTAPRTALAAEAAHVISPIGAQGLNLSLRDVKTLADIIIQSHELGLDIGSAAVLNKYERARKSDVVSRSFTIDLANQAVANDKSAIRALRRLTLRALSLPGPWRHLVMKKGLAA